MRTWNVNNDNFAYSSFGILADCDCSSTSMVYSDLPYVPDRTSLIPKKQTFSMAPGAAPEYVEVPLTYDTISFVCGAADG